MNRGWMPIIPMLTDQAKASGKRLAGATFLQRDNLA